MFSSFLYISWSFFPTLYRFIYGGGRPINAIIKHSFDPVFAVLMVLWEGLKETEVVKEFWEVEILYFGRN